MKDISYRLLKFYTTQQDEYFFGLELINTTQMKLSYRYNASQNKDFLKLYEILRETFVRFASGAYY